MAKQIANLQYCKTIIQIIHYVILLHDRNHEFSIFIHISKAILTAMIITTISIDDVLLLVQHIQNNDHGNSFD